MSKYFASIFVEFARVGCPQVVVPNQARKMIQLGLRSQLSSPPRI